MARMNKKIIYWTVSVAFFSAATLAQQATTSTEQLLQENALKNSSERLRVQKIEDIALTTSLKALDDFSVIAPALEASMAELEQSLATLQNVELEALQRSMELLEQNLKNLQVEIPPLPPLEALEALDIPPLPPIDLHALQVQLEALDIPPLEALEALDIPPLPPIDLHALEVQLEALDIPPLPPVDVIDLEVAGELDHWSEAFNADDDLSEDERAQLEVIKARAHAHDTSVIALVDTIVRESGNPALRYFALQYLSIIDDENVVPLLIYAAKNDVNTTVRKLAIRSLGRSNDDRALAALQEIVR